MEFITKNLLQTTTDYVVQSNTSLVQFLFRRDRRFQYASTGFNNDATTTTIQLSLGQTTSVSRLALVNMNWKDFTIHYNGTTANTLNLTSTGATTSSDWSSNSEPSMYLQFATIQATQIDIDITGTITADAEKSIGYVYVADTKLVFPRVPSSSQYKARYDVEQKSHKLSDGSTRLSTVDKKYRADIKLEYIEPDFADNLYNVWTEHNEFGFVAFPTTTGWDEIVYPVVWPGDFNFIEYADDAVNSGFAGKIMLRETQP